MNKQQKEVFELLSNSLYYETRDGEYLSKDLMIVLTTPHTRDFSREYSEGVGVVFLFIKTIIIVFTTLFCYNNI